VIEVLAIKLALVPIEWSLLEPKSCQDRRQKHPIHNVIVRIYVKVAKDDDLVVCWVKVMFQKTLQLPNLLALVNRYPREKVRVVKVDFAQNALDVQVDYVYAVFKLCVQKTLLRHDVKRRPVSENVQFRHGWRR